MEEIFKQWNSLISDVLKKALGTYFMLQKHSLDEKQIETLQESVSIEITDFIKKAVDLSIDSKLEWEIEIDKRKAEIEKRRAEKKKRKEEKLLSSLVDEI